MPPLAKSLELWTAQTICDVAILLTWFSCALHVGRAYFERVMSRLSLRVAADLWWLGYLVMRDGSLFAAALLGLLGLNLDLMADIKIGLPFVPLATVCTVAALSVKVLWNADAKGRAAQWVLGLVASAGLLDTIGYVFVMEAPGDEYAAAQTAFWQLMKSWRSNLNPGLSTATFYVTAALLTFLVVLAMTKAIVEPRSVTGRER
jgi:hypothetical protein